MVDGAFHSKCFMAPSRVIYIPDKYRNLTYPVALFQTTQYA